jgi:hypothetical protein
MKRYGMFSGDLDLSGSEVLDLAIKTGVTDPRML